MRIGESRNNLDVQQFLTTRTFTTLQQTYSTKRVIFKVKNSETVKEFGEGEGGGG